MSNNYYVCTENTFEMTVLSSSLSPIRKANCIEEAEDSQLLYHPTSSSHKLFLLFACLGLYV